MARDSAAVGRESEIRRRDGSTLWISESVRTVVDPVSDRTVYQGSIVDVTARREMQAAQERARLAASPPTRPRAFSLARHLRRDPPRPRRAHRRQRRTSPHPHRRNPRPFAHQGRTHGTAPRPVLAGRATAHGRRSLRRAPPKRGWSFAAYGDPLRQWQVLDNLPGDAFKFTARGSVALNVRRAGATGVRFEVTDTGVGIPPDQCATIFEPFRQVAPRRLPDRSCVGFVRHIAARLVRLMGGELRVASMYGQGSRFFFELPLLNGNAGGDARADFRFERRPAATREQTALPPAAEIESLLTLSLQGDIVRLRARLRELADADAALADFTREVSALALGFRMDAISEFLTRPARGTRTIRATASRRPRWRQEQE